MFGWASRLLAARRSRERVEPEQSRIPPQARTLAGVFVTPDRALTNSVVWACVRYLSSTVAQLPWYVKRDIGDGRAEIVRRHPVDTVLSWRPNPELSPFAFRETLMGWALLWGNGYAEIVRDAAGRVIELWPIHPSRVQVRRDLDTDRLFYRVDGPRYGGGSIDLDPRDVFHVRGFGDGPVGLNVVEHAAQSIGWAQATELFGASFFGNGLNQGGFIEIPGGLDGDGKDRLNAQLEERHKGPRKAHRWTLLDAGMKAVKSSATPDESQFVETMQHQVEVICRWFGAPPHKVAHLLRATFSNIEHQSIEVVVDAVTPWVIRFEQEADFKLFGANRGGFFTDIDLRGLMRGDAKARGEYYQMMRNTGAYSVNQILVAEGENPIGPEGDKRVMQSQYTTLERIGEEPPPAAASPGADQKGDPPSADPEDPEDDPEDPEDATDGADIPAALLERLAHLRSELDHVGA